MGINVVDKLLGDATPQIWERIVLAGLVVLFTFYISLAGGLFPWFAGFALQQELRILETKVATHQNESIVRFATISDYTNLTSKVDSIELRMIMSDINVSQERWCKMYYIDKNKAASSYAQQLRQQLTDRYFALTGREAKVPSCVDLGIK